MKVKIITTAVVVVMALSALFPFSHAVRALLDLSEQQSPGSGERLEQQH